MKPEFTIYPPDPESPEGMEERAATLLRDAQLVRLAETLRVEPCTERVKNIMVALVTADGRTYSWAALVEAHIRLMESDARTEEREARDEGASDEH